MRPALASLVLLVVLGAGCSGAPLQPAPEVAPEAPDPAGGGSTAAAGNAFLLEALRPPGADVSDGAEPTILVDREGRAIWIGDTAGLAVSYNNGTTWQEGPSPFLLSADGWGLAQDDEGTLFMSTTSALWIDVARSTDLGRTFELVGRVVDAAPVADRPWIAARGSGEVALIFYAFGRVVDEACARSQDGGLTWLDRQPLAGHPNPGNVVFGDDGTLYFADGGGDVWVLEGGCGLANVSYLNAPFRLFGDMEFGANQMLQVALDGDELYSAAPDASGAIVLAGARDLGTPRRLTVSPAMLRSNTFAAVSAHGDEVAVAWYGSETPGDPSVVGYKGEFNVFVARVRDFWGSPQVTYYRLTQEPNHVGDICMGGIGCTPEADRDLLDYFGVDHDPWGGIHVAYGHDGSGSNAVVRYARIPPGFPGATLDLPAAAPTLPAAAGVPPSDPDAPKATFTHSARGLRVEVDASESSDPQGDGLEFAWDFGDGTAATGPTATHTYPASGAYRIVLRVTDRDGNVASAEQGLIVDGTSNNLPPEVRIRIEPDRPVAGALVVAVDESSDPDGAIAARAWTLDGQLVGTGPDVRLRLDAGTYVVRLRVTDDGGASSSQGVRITVMAAAAAAAAPAEPAEPGGQQVQVQVPASGPMLLAVLAAAAWLTRRRT